nr:hypothetical protein [Tanacetum cinerariifolium]
LVVAAVLGIGYHNGVDEAAGAAAQQVIVLVGLGGVEHHARAQVVGEGAVLDGIAQARRGR